MRNWICTLSLAVLLGSLVPGFGQTLGAPSIDASRRTEGAMVKPATTVLRSDATMDQSPIDSFTGFAPESAGDSDIGQQMILHQREKISNFTFNADAYLFWTDNAAHVPRGEVDDVFWGWRAELSWFPRIHGNLFGGVSLAQDWVRYNAFEGLNFETMEVTPGLSYVVPQLRNTTFFVQYQYQRLTQDFDELMNRHAARFGVHKTWLINRRNAIDTMLLGSWDIDNDVDQLKRNEYSADIAWHFKLTQSLRMALQYRYTFFDYAEFGREDSLHLVGLNFEWSIRKWLVLYAYASYAFNDSNYSVYDYQAGSTGGGIGLRAKF